ncbi:hypothetical protein, partial [Herbaspirillum sp.]|uniref:hypothetical protein n=1 Tax=Herbaspirillum sp. TaxID=1890675 RepID=UPI00258E9AA6
MATKAAALAKNVRLSTGLLLRFLRSIARPTPAEHLIPRDRLAHNILGTAQDMLALCRRIPKPA